MNNLMTLEAMMIVNGLSIQHSSEWEDYVAMNARLHGLTEEEWMAYYGSDDITTESLSQLLEKKVTRKQLDKALNDLAKITNDLKKVVKEWAAARDAGKTEKQEEKLEELKKLNDDKAAAQKVVDDHIQQLDKNATLQTTESVNEAVSRSTKIYCVATPAPRKQLVEELEDIFGDDYRNIVTEFTDDEGYESVLLFNLTRNDIALIQKRVADVLIWEYSIKKGREIMESLNEKIKVASLADAIEAERDGDLNKKHLDKILKRKEDGTIHQMTRSEEKTYHAILRKYKIEEAIDIDMINADVEFAFDIFEGIMSNLHQMADEIGDEDKFVKAFFSEYGDKIKKSSDSEEWVRSLYKDTVNENIDTMKKLQTLENFNEAAPRMSDSAETQNLLNLRDEIANAQKGGSEGRYGKDFEKAKVKALRAIEQMITYTKIGV